MQIWFDKTLSTIAIGRAGEKDLRRSVSRVQQIVAVHLTSSCSRFSAARCCRLAWVLQVLTCQRHTSPCSECIAASKSNLRSYVFVGSFHASHLFCSRLAVACCHRPGLNIVGADLTASLFILHRSVSAVQYCPMNTFLCRQPLLWRPPNHHATILDKHLIPYIADQYAGC